MSVLQLKYLEHYYSMSNRIKFIQREVMNNSYQISRLNLLHQVPRKYTAVELSIYCQERQEDDLEWQ